MIAVIGILSVIPFGIYGLLYFQLIFSIGSCYINSYYSGELINYSVKEQLADIFPAIFLSVCTGLLCFFIDAFLVQFLQLSDIGRLIIDSLFFYSFFLITSHLMQFNAIYDFKHLVLKR
jgi:hypothetical protein